SSTFQRYTLSYCNVSHSSIFFFFITPPTPDLNTLSLHDALPICPRCRTTAGRFRDAPPSRASPCRYPSCPRRPGSACWAWLGSRSEEHTSELQSRGHLVCRLLLEKKKKNDLKRKY